MWYYIGMRKFLFSIRFFVAVLVLFFAFGANFSFVSAESLGVSISSPSSGAIFEVGQSFSISATVSGGQPFYNYWFDFGDGISCGSPSSSSSFLTCPHTYRNPGSYVISLSVQDSVGLVGSAAITVTVTGPPPPPPPPLPTISSVSPSSVTQGENFLVLGSGFTSSGSEVSVTSGLQKTALPTSFVDTNTLQVLVPDTLPAGTYQVSAKNANGESSSSVSLMVSAKPPPLPDDTDQYLEDELDIIIDGVPIILNPGDEIPVISSISPTNAVPGTSVTATGSGFSTSGNVVHLVSATNGEDSTISNIPSVDGLHFTFTTPNVLPGSYNLSVENSAGNQSNEISFTIPTVPSEEWWYAVDTGLSTPDIIGSFTSKEECLAAASLDGTGIVVRDQTGNIRCENDPSLFAPAAASLKIDEATYFYTPNIGDVRITGTGFVSGLTTVNLADASDPNSPVQTLNATFISSTELRFTLPPSLSMGDVTYELWVTNGPIIFSNIVSLASRSYGRAGTTKYGGGYGLVPCGYDLDGKDGIKGTDIVSKEWPIGSGKMHLVQEECDFNALLILAKNIMDFLFIISASIAAICFCVAGIMYLTSGGNPGKAEQAKHIFVYTGIGFVFILGAWLFVSFIESSLLPTPQAVIDYSLLKRVVN